MADWTYTQVCPPAGTSEAHVRGQKVALPPPFLGSPASLTSHDTSCQSNSLGRKQGFSRDGLTLPPARDCHKLYTELPGRNGGSAARNALKARLPEEKGEKSLAGTARPLRSSLQQEPSSGPGRNRKPPSVRPPPPAGPAWRKQVRWDGFLSALQLQKAQASSSKGQTCWGPPCSGDPHCPPTGHFANCLAIIVHGPKSVTWCQRPGCPRWAGVGWGGLSSREHPLPGCEVPRAPPPAAHAPQHCCQC